MSYELVIAAGAPAAAAAARRDERVRHAANRVPGAVDVAVVSTEHACVALVSTAPAGGSSGSLAADAGRVDVVVATSPFGEVMARTADSRSCGAEAGHARVQIAPDGEVVLSTDGIAFLPCYFALHGDGLLVSTHLASLVSLGLPARVDEQGLCEYLALLHPLEQRTLLAGAQALPPGGRVLWRTGRAPTVQARPLFTPGATPPCSDAEAVGTFREVWSSVLGDLATRTSGTRVLQGLSGGLDSRAMAVGLAAHGVRPLSYTYGSHRSREAVVAAQVADRLALPHLVVPVPPERRLRGATRLAEVLDGAHSVSQMYELWFTDLLQSAGDVVVNGLAGGPLWGDDKAVGLVDERRVEEKIWARYASAARAVEAFARPVSTEKSASELVRAGITASLRTWDFSQRDDVPVYWKLANRQVRWGNMLVNALRREGLRLEAPFLDSRTLRFCARLTPEQRRNGRLYLRVHREVLTPTADIARSDDGNSPRGLNHVYWSAKPSMLRQLAGLTAEHPVSGLRRASRRAFDVGAGRLVERGTITAAAAERAERASVFPAEVWLRTCATYRDRLATLLEEAALAGGPLQPDAIRRAASHVRDGRTTTSAALLGNVATAGAWMRDYAERARDVPG